MISFEEALIKVLELVEPMPPTRIPTGRLAGHVLAEPVVAGLDMPPFDNSAVDGFGVKAVDVLSAAEANPVRLAVVATIRAGDERLEELVAGTAVKILTGAFVPPCVDAVVMKEFCSEDGNDVLVTRPAASGDNIRRRGAEFLRGRQVLNAGAIVTPPVVGLLANLGFGSFSVHRKPKAAVITTGGELTRPGRDLLPGRIYDSNSYALQAALAAAGVEDCLSVHAAEQLAATKRAFEQALGFADLVISTGGVSVGDYDYVKPVLEMLGVRTELWRIAIKPGKPVYFGVLYDGKRRRHKYIFGLPGNPVSALVTYHQFVKPALEKLMGLTTFARRDLVKAKLTSDLNKKAGRTEFVRARLIVQDGFLYVEPTSGQDSHMLGGLATADVLIHFAQELEHLAAGTAVPVERLVWTLH